MNPLQSYKNADPDPVDPGWELGLCISHMLPGHIDAAGPGSRKSPEKMMSECVT